ncbi:hypothetical protein [Streptomyces sp. NPDC097610]|uniref:hypothetical protein n=1 Tax=Streptomyces sp. NPDC097610 TaxID=3157227 RepID=UPI0033339FB7
MTFDDPRNPTGNWFTGERFEKALNVTLNSVVFRSADQELTTSGTYSEMASRLTELILLGLAVLAVRNRVNADPAATVVTAAGSLVADLPTHLSAGPTEVTVGRWGELNIFACPEEPNHPHRWSIQ